MLIKYLQRILTEERLRGSNSLYLRTSLKEYLQVVILNFIYTSSKYKNELIFTGGTCLRHFYGLQRLSEDLDFDFIQKVDSNLLAHDLETYFKSSLQYRDLIIAVKQKNRQILLKFPVMRQLGLASESESDLLYIKLDLSPAVGIHYSTEKTAKSISGYNFVAVHYDLPSLFAGKVAAVLSRNLLKGQDNRETVKGRDFFDLLWYLKQGVELDAEQVKERLGEKLLTAEQILRQLDEKVELACTKFKFDFKNDLMPFISDAEFAQDFVNNYGQEYNRERRKIKLK